VNYCASKKLIIEVSKFEKWSIVSFDFFCRVHHSLKESQERIIRRKCDQMRRRK
jgi:hypothetical protein